MGGRLLLNAAAHRVSAFWLDSYYAHGRALEFHGRGDAGDEAASSHRNYYYADGGDLFENLEPHRSLAGHDRQVVERMDQREVSLLLQGQALIQQAALGLD